MCDQGLLVLYLTVWVQNGEGLWIKNKPQWLSAHVVVLVTALNFNFFSFVAISTSLENNNKIQMN